MKIKLIRGATILGYCCYVALPLTVAAEESEQAIVVAGPESVPIQPGSTHDHETMVVAEEDAGWTPASGTPSEDLDLQDEDTRETAEDPSESSSSSTGSQQTDSNLDSSNCFDAAMGMGRAAGDVADLDRRDGFFVITAATTAASATVSSIFCLPTVTTEASTGDNDSAYLELQRQRYIARAGNHLARDIARADGEYVATMAYLHGCPSGLVDHYATIARQNFSVIFPESKVPPKILLSNLKTRLSQDPVLAEGCKYLS